MFITKSRKLQIVSTRESRQGQELFWMLVLKQELLAPDQRRRVIGYLID